MDNETLLAYNVEYRAHDILRRLRFSFLFHHHAGHDDGVSVSKQSVQNSKAARNWLWGKSFDFYLVHHLGDYANLEEIKTNLTSFYVGFRKGGVAHILYISNLGTIYDFSKIHIYVNAFRKSKSTEFN